MERLRTEFVLTQLTNRLILNYENRERYTPVCVIAGSMMHLNYSTRVISRRRSLFLSVGVFDYTRIKYSPERLACSFPG